MSWHNTHVAARSHTYRLPHYGEECLDRTCCWCAAHSVWARPFSCELKRTPGGIERLCSDVFDCYFFLPCARSTVQAA
eukprot:1159754-Pelagomonas_calceolata.AAC.1